VAHLHRCSYLNKVHTVHIIEEANGRSKKRSIALSSFQTFLASKCLSTKKDQTGALAMLECPELMQHRMRFSTFLYREVFYSQNVWSDEEEVRL
jgi:hypothetical protein